MPRSNPERRWEFIPPLENYPQQSALGEKAQISDDLEKKTIKKTKPVLFRNTGHPSPLYPLVS